MSDNENEVEIVEYPILYHAEKRRKWKVWVVGDVIYRRDGLSSKEFTKKPSARKVTAKRGTTSNEQALRDAKKYWVKKLDQGFAPHEDDEEGRKEYQLAIDLKNEQGGNNHGVSVGKAKTSKASTITITKKHLPMLAQKYEERKASVIWASSEKETLVAKIGKKRFHDEYFDATEGAFITTKLDGVHCIAYLEGPETVLLTRNGKQFVFLQHIRDAVRIFLKDHQYVLAGELYVHAPSIDGKVLKGAERFGYISSACRTVRSRAHPHEGQIQLHVFDLFDPSQPELSQIKRLKMLRSLFEDYKETNKIIPVRIHVIKTPEAINKYQAKFSIDGYEGVILRDPRGTYQGGKKSLHLLKYKLFEDREYPIVGAECSSEGAVIWVCELDDGNTFHVTMMGDLDVRKDMYENYTDYLGKLLTVRYQELSKDNIPRFPRGVAIRDYE